jgi:signal transduction histidine kinase
LLRLDWGLALSVAILIGLAWFLQDRGLKLARIRSQATEYEDLTRDRALRLEQKNKALMEKQDYEVRVATLRERNRIARDIHDHVGHLLTRAILQLGAIQTISRSGPLHEPLTGLKQTLDDSMTEIRRSLHDLHDASVDLTVELEAMVGPFTFCPVSLVIGLREKPDQPLVLAFLAIVREGLSNIARHSNATQASLLLREHPGFYQLTLRDNGTSQEADGPVDLEQLTGQKSSGIGLAGMAERVRALNGQINIRREQGFVILITVPRQDRTGGRRDE